MIAKTIDYTVIHQRHLAGESVNSLSKSFGICRKTITNYFTKLGLSWRDSTTSQQLIWDTKTESQRQHFIDVHKGFWDRQPESYRKKVGQRIGKANKGRKQTMQHLLHRAEGVQRMCRQSIPEYAMCKILDIVGISFIPQMAIGKFNVDIAIPSNKIGIEINGGGWHYSAKKMKQDSEKAVYLSENGWTIVVIRTNHKKGVVKFCAQNLVALFEVLGLNPSMIDNINRVIPS